MAYQLTLTPNERKAIDWVGYRDWNGDSLSALLWGNCQPPNCGDWDANEDITFNIPEFVAWDIKALYEQNDCTIPHFADELTAKLQDFFDKIV